MNSRRVVPLKNSFVTTLGLAAMLGGAFLACGKSDGSGSDGTGGKSSGGQTASGGSSSAQGGSTVGGSSSTSSPSGGKSSGGSSSVGSGGSTGGSSQTSAAGGSISSCPNATNVNACGGDVVGTWDVKSSCLAISGTINPQTANLDCTSAPVSGTLRVTGSLVAKADGSYADNTETSGSLQFTLGKSCLVISSTPIECDQAGSILGTAGYGEVSCVAASDGGCSCSAKIKQTGSMGLLLQSPSTTGKYKATASALTFSGEDSPEASYPYCVSGTTLTLSAQTTSPISTGTIVLQKQTTPTGGTGGTSNTGGTGGKASGGTASGGTTSTGGKATSGGTTASGGSGGTTSSTSSGTTPPAGARPCDVLAAASSPCVAAHSTVRAMFANYTKALYQVRKGGTWDGNAGVTGGDTKDIMVGEGGIADAAAQDQFCGTTSQACTISIIYDQTGNGNDLKVAKMCETCNGCPGNDAKKGKYDMEAYADLAKTTINGKAAYGVRVLPCGNSSPNQTGYRVTTPKGIVTGDKPESAYFVVDGANMNGGCCFDYGNSNPNGMASGNMDAVYLGSYGAWGTGAGSGPWVGADLEAGIYTWNGKSGNWKNPNSQSLKFPFVTALLKNNQKDVTADEGPFVLKGGDARSGALTTMWSGARPQGYEALNKKGGMVLGIGGDGAAGAQGTFFEGAITAAFNSKAADDALQANIVAAGYGK